MARIRFLNPNEPEQPAHGVYRWYCLRDREEFTLYVGSTGKRDKSLSSPSTLRRGILEATRSSLTSDNGSKLDTDFIVGTAILYFKAEGFDCCWEHVLNPVDPFSAAFITKNENRIFAVHDLNFVCWTQLIKTSHHIQVLGPGLPQETQGTIPVLIPNASSTIGCPHVIGGLGSYTGEVLQAQILDGRF